MDQSFGSFFDEEWEGLSTMFSSDQDSDHFPFHGLFSCEQDDHGFNFETQSSTPWVVSSENVNPNSHQYYFSQEINNHDSFPYPSSNINIPLSTNGVHDHQSTNLFINENNINNNSSLLAQVFYDESMEGIQCLRSQDVDIENSVDQSEPIADLPKAKRKIQIKDKVNDDIQANKKTRVSKDNKNKKKVQPKKKQKKVMTHETINDNGISVEENNNKGDGNAPIMSSSSCSSEDEVNPCQDSNGGTVNSNWKTRAGRGAATDPQSLYARKRRERINERLKILQNLVPNGTKVDISTMLEEAVQYVKFLQLQIKLLSSDEMWMYAPIAYNGMDIGLYQKLSHSQN